MQPGGASEELLGVDAVREFNVLRDSYGAEYGKQPGGQVIIVTQSGTTSCTASLYEFLRNNALDAPNYFDVGSAPPFQRNQFGGSLGGPIERTRHSSSPITKASASACIRLVTCAIRARACAALVRHSIRADGQVRRRRR